MLANLRLAPLLLALAAALAGCDRARPIAAPEAAGGVDAGALAACSYCHGDAARPEADALLQAAPPRTATGAPAGAHDRHLHGGAFRSAIACAECHAVPRSAGHQDGTVDLAFGALARAGGATPSFAGGACSGVYCHGATLAGGGTDPSPSWEGAVGCTSCHAYPPPSHAAEDTGCATCHPGTVHADGTLNLAGGLHVNGTVDVGAAHAAGWGQPASHGPAANGDLASCRRCHGDDLGGGTSRVSCDGCHSAAGYADWRTNCTFCHGTQVASYGAADLPRAAPPLGTQGETATTARAVGAHEQHLSGGAIGPSVACGECHAALPADLGHVDGTASVSFGQGARRGGASPAWNGNTCATSYCHGATLGAGGTNTAPAWTGGPSQASCGTCHGAPPPAPHPANAACGACHPGYTATSVDLATHVDGKLDLGELGCTSCHGAPPPDPHPASAACGSCHPGYTATSVNPTTHADGELDLGAMSCTSCHGKAGQAATAASPLAAAPPADVSGATSGARVGAHQKHLLGGSYANALACRTCHASVGSYGAGHADGTRQVGFSGAANANLAKGAWNPGAGAAAGSCSATWCHGAVISRTGGTSGGSLTAPSWTASISSCTSCHSVSLSSLPNRHPKHSSKAACGDCHPGYTATAVNRALHVDGAKSVGGSGTKVTSWNGTSCATTCHENQSW